MPCLWAPSLFGFTKENCNFSLAFHRTTLSLSAVSIFTQHWRLFFITFLCKWSEPNELLARLRFPPSVPAPDFLCKQNQGGSRLTYVTHQAEPSFLSLQKNKLRQPRMERRGLTLPLARCRAEHRNRKLWPRGNSPRRRGLHWYCVKKFSRAPLP